MHSYVTYIKTVNKQRIAYELLVRLVSYLYTYLYLTRYFNTIQKYRDKQNKKLAYLKTVEPNRIILRKRKFDHITIHHWRARSTTLTARSAENRI